MRLLPALAAALLASSAANAVIVVNGSFEDGADIAPGGFLTLTGGDDSSITGWTVLNDGVDYIGTYWQASDGVRSLDLSSETAGGVMQMISGFETGKHYRITFDISANSGSLTRPRRLVASATGGEAVIYSYLNPDNTNDNMQYETFTYDFFASGLMQQISFKSLDLTPYGPVLDNVSISLVPEPATWGLMIAGFTFTGALVRRRARMRSTLA